MHNKYKSRQIYLIKTLYSQKIEQVSMQSAVNFRCKRNLQRFIEEYKSVLNVLKIPGNKERMWTELNFIKFRLMIEFETFCTRDFIR